MYHVMCIAKCCCKGTNIFGEPNHKFGTVLVFFVWKLYMTRDLLFYSFSIYTSRELLMCVNIRCFPLHHTNPDLLVFQIHQGS